MTDPRQLLPAGLAAFSSDELELLREYHDHVAELDDRALADRKTFTIHIGDGGDTLAQVGSQDEIIALATTFRKLGWAQKDRATFDQIRNLIARHARDAGTPEGEEIGEWAKQIKGLRQDMLRQSRVFGYVLDDGSGQPERLTPKQILDIVINGAVFHSDAELRARWKELGGWSSVPLVTIALVTMWDAAQVFRALDLLVQDIMATPQLHVA